MKIMKVIALFFKLTMVLVSLYFVVILWTLFSEEIRIAIGNIPRGGIYRIEAVEGDVIKVRRLKPNSNLQDTTSWEFEGRTRRVSLSRLWDADRLDSLPQTAKEGGYFIVWKHHLKDINLMTLRDEPDKDNAFTVWRAIHNW